MKVGKPKSKRVPVRLRHKIEKASVAKQRKSRKEAKKNPQWRSRLKKDPGIPNLFPYKAKVLAEIEESKRRKEEEAQRRRDVAKAQRQGKTVAEVEQTAAEDDVEEENDDDEVLLDHEDDVDDDEGIMDEQKDSNPMAALVASAQARAQAYTHNDENGDDEDEENEDEWAGIEESTTISAPAQAIRKALPKQALTDPIKAVSALLDRMRKTTDGIQRLLDHYKIPPLVTAGIDMTSSFLVEVARKRGRLGKGGVPNLHSAALTVLGDLNDQRLELPAIVAGNELDASGKGEVQIVSQMAAPFRIEGLWGDAADGGEGKVDTMVVEA